MNDFQTLRFDKPRAWIREKIQGGKSWDEVLMACKSTEEKLVRFLENQEEDNDWPAMNVDDWKKLVDLQYQAERNTIAYEEQTGASMIHNDEEDNGVNIPTDSETAWQTYKKSLEEKGFKNESITTIERSTLRILRRLSTNTTDKEAIKGLVVGNVQSGKTANMAALMAMAADWGWNMFIILSGTIDNLRKQTQSRLYEDLNQPECRLTWRSMDHLKKRMAAGSRAQDLHFEAGSGQRYFTVCLKNSSRLRDLIQWLQYSPSTQDHMKILVIDDEADQAGINTSDISSTERTKINKLICALVNGKNEKNKPVDSHYQAMNYIGYTATPYANVLNEAGEESLYPRNFISTLSVSKEYFGPQQIFGIEGGDYQGLDIVRKISQENVNDIKEIHDGNSLILSDTFLDSLCWFICGVSCMRYWHYKKPISMLVHTSQRTDHHNNIAIAIEQWLTSQSERAITERCRKVWEYETDKFSFAKFREQYPDYDRVDFQIPQYPTFEDLKKEIHILLDGVRVSNIKMAEDQTLTYHDGLHLCVDNCRNNGADGEWYLRLAYPDKEHMPTPAPAFIVVGGATLSRGLTLEGLISTFFLRTVNQADTLMQMGRWFGYRKGYELIPRIWLTEKTIDQFKFLSALDQELRDEIQTMDVTGKSPAHYGPRVKNTPKLSFLRITARNRMQSAEPTDLDYSGTFKQTHLFDLNKDVLQKNLDCTTTFLDILGTPEPEDENRFTRPGVVWLNVPFAKVKDYLHSYKFQTRQSVFNDIDTLLEWIDSMTNQGYLCNWNVVLAGLKANNDEDFFISCGRGIKMVNRALKVTNENPITAYNIGALRNTKDLLADIDITQIDDPELIEEIKNPDLTKTKLTRVKAHYDNIPLLLIYIVDKDSKAQEGSETRKDLNAPVHLAGLCVNIPGDNGGRSNYVSTISIHMDNEDLFNDNGDIDGADEN